MTHCPLLLKRTFFTCGISFIAGGSALGQTTLTFQDGLGFYAGTRDTAVRSSTPNSSGGQLQEIGWNADFAAQTYEFSQGQSAYFGTKDTVISGADPSADAGSWDYWGWDTDAFGSPFAAYTLIRFDSIVGIGANQVPLGANVVSAELTYECYNTGGLADVHDMLSNWDEGTNWNTFSFGYNPVPTSVASGASQGSCDLTTSVGQVVSGAPNLGWVLIPRSDDGVEAHSSESTVGARPKLTIQTEDEDVAHALMRFEGLVGFGTGQIPPGATVHSAVLSYETSNTGDAAEVRALLSPWSEQETWTSFQGLSYGETLAFAPGGSGQQSVDVTASVQSFVDGAPNYGWVLFGVGSDGVEFYSREFGIADRRPRLEVSFSNFQSSGLKADTLTVSAINGGTQNLDLDLGSSLAFKLYLVLGTANGTTPGFSVDGMFLPLTLDNYLLQTISQANTGIYQNTLGVLDANGQASASLQVPAQSLTGFVGLKLNHVGVALEPTFLNVLAVSNPVLLNVVP